MPEASVSIFNVKQRKIWQAQPIEGISNRLLPPFGASLPSVGRYVPARASRLASDPDLIGSLSVPALGGATLAQH